MPPLDFRIQSEPLGVLLQTLKCLYVALVRPHLEYTVPVWDPHFVKHLDLLEKVQKFAMKVCTKSWYSTHSSQLTQTSLPQLDQKCVQLKLLSLSIIS